MNRAQLEHAIRSACRVAQDNAVWIIGSQAILGQHPNAHPDLLRSDEADIIPRNRPEQSNLIDGALGELSIFHQTTGFYVHGVALETATLPKGWQKRCILVRNPNTDGFSGWCLEGHDLALSKLAAYREKDRSFVRVLLREGLVWELELLRRLTRMSLAKDHRARLQAWIQETARDLRDSDPQKQAATLVARAVELRRLTRRKPEQLSEEQRRAVERARKELDELAPRLKKARAELRRRRKKTLDRER